MMRGACLERLGASSRGCRPAFVGAPLGGASSAPRRGGWPFCMSRATSLPGTTRPRVGPCPTDSLPS
eukprot:2364970-Lingulodinium_polyedra.AAC.1